jgi:hypothetical protein
MRQLTKQDRKRFAELVALEPELGVMLKRARSVMSRTPKTKLICGLMLYNGEGCWAGWCLNGKRPDWNTTPEAKLDKLVGWHREQGPDELKTREAYEIACAMIYWALPPCNMPPCSIPSGYPSEEEVLERYGLMGEDPPF